MEKHRILCYGDSNTFGSRPDGLALRYSDDERWAGVLQNCLGPEYQVIVEGLPGRTTVWEDPIEPYRNGSAYLTPCLRSHAPLDLVILLLGTNDLKMRFSATPLDIARGVGRLIELVYQSGAGRNGQAPKVLLLSPALPGMECSSNEIFNGAVEKAPRLGRYFQEIAVLFGCEFIDLAPVIRSSELDGIHLDLNAHDRLGQVVAAKVLTYWQKT